MLAVGAIATRVQVVDAVEVRSRLMELAGLKATAAKRASGSGSSSLPAGGTLIFAFGPCVAALTRGWSSVARRPISARALRLMVPRVAGEPTPPLQPQWGSAHSRGVKMAANRATAARALRNAKLWSNGAQPRGGRPENLVMEAVSLRWRRSPPTQCRSVSAMAQARGALWSPYSKLNRVCAPADPLPTNQRDPIIFVLRLSSPPCRLPRTSSVA